MSDHPHPIPTVQVVAYALGILPVAALALPLSIFLPPLYGDTLGVGVGIVGTIFVTARLWDFVTDLAIGWMIERYPSRWGKRKHWVVLSLPFLLVAGWRLYLPPEAVTWVYLSFWLFVLYIGFTLLLVTHYAWGAELSADQRQRAALFGWRDTALIFGILLCVIAPTIGEQFFGFGQIEQVVLLGKFLLITLPIAALGLIWFLPDEPYAAAPVTPIRRALLAAKNDRIFRTPILLDFVTGIAQGVTASTFIFAATYVYEMPDQATTIVLINFVAAFFALPFWIKATQRWGPYLVFRYALAFAALANTLYLAVPSGGYYLLFAVVILNGVAFGPPMFLTRTLMASAIDRTASDKQPPVVAMGFSLMTMSNKIAGAIAVGISFGVLAMVDFEPQVEPPGPVAVMTLKVLFGTLPALLFFLAFRLLNRLIRYVK